MRPHRKPHKEYCHGIGPGALYAAGIELNQDGDWFALVENGSGALVQATDDAHRGRWGAGPPVTLQFRFENAAQQTLVVLLEQDGTHFSVARSTFETVNIGYVRE